jgi:transposase
MRISEAQYERIAGHFPVQRGNVKTDNRLFIDAILYMVENGCKWRALPKEYGKWSTIYKKFNRWAKNGAMQRIFTALQAEEIITIHVEVLTLDSTSCKVHPNAHGALRNLGSRQSASREAAAYRRAESALLPVARTPSFIWYPQMIRSSLKCTSQAESVTMHPKAENR